jgi:hypothetical protein
MDRRRVEDLLGVIESGTRSIDQGVGSASDHTNAIRSAVADIRRELNPPEEDDNRQRTRDEISPREWAEYEWHDVTAFGDKQRQYIRGLKR